MKHLNRNDLSAFAAAMIVLADPDPQSRLDQAKRLSAAAVPDELVTILCKIAASGRVTREDLAQIERHGYPVMPGPMPEFVTDEEWARFQQIPDQGYSHRHWVNVRIADRLDAQRRQLLDPETIDSAKLAIHRALAPEWMTVVGALGADQDAYERLITDIAEAVLVSAMTPSA